MEPFSSYKDIIEQKLVTGDDYIYDVNREKKHIIKKLASNKVIEKSIPTNNFYPIHKHILGIHTLPKNKKIYIGFYNISNDVYPPYLRYLFTKGDESILNFRSINNYDSDKLSNIIKGTVGKNIDVDGYVIYKDVVYILCNVENINYINSNEYKWCNMYEICNNEKHKEYKINNNVKLFFYNNPILIYLLDKNNNPYKIESIVY